ncbi:MAG: hypothetical protein NTZ33_02335 [Bacteroidetes bacterium]|nr:hypothetical protein [Bacteroidota bacterium]
MKNIFDTLFILNQSLYDFTKSILGEKSPESNNSNNSNNETTKLATILLTKQNNQALKYSKFLKRLLVLIILIYMLLLINHLKIFTYKSSSFLFTFNIKLFFFSFIDISGLIIIYILIKLSKIRNKLIKYLINKKGDIHSNKDNSIHDTIIIAAKLLVSMIILTILLVAPGILNHIVIIPNIINHTNNFLFFIQFKNQLIISSVSNFFSIIPNVFEFINSSINYIAHNSIKFNQLIGYIISSVIISILTIYLVFLMPDIILYKIEKSDSEQKKYKYLYWLYFFKARFVESPVILIITIPLLTILFVLITILYFLPTGTMIDRIKFTCITLIITTLITIAADLLKSYTNLSKVFNDYSNHQIKNRLILINKFPIIIIGHGNYGSTVLKTLFSDFLHYLGQVFKQRINSSSNQDFEIIIDRDFDLRLISRNHLIIENNNNKLEEVFSDNSFHFKYGFLSTINYSQKRENVPQIEIDPRFGLPGIIADGSDLGLWKILKFNERPVIIDTTSDNRMNVELKKHIESGSIRLLSNPLVITTVNSELIENTIMKQTKFSSFPINYTYYEGISLVQRLVQLISKIGYSNLHNINIFMSCQKNVIPEIINSIKTNLILFEQHNIVLRFIQEHIFIDTQSPSIQDPISSNYFPNFMNNITYSIIFDKFLNINLKNTEKSFYTTLFTNKPTANNVNIFIIFANSPFLDIKLLIDIRNLIHTLNKKSSYILTSISEEYSYEAKNIITSHTNSLIEDNKSIFPSSADDFIMNKNHTISNQIASLFAGVINRPSNYNMPYLSPDNKIYQLETCLHNTPLSFLHILSKLKGYELKINSKEESPIPSFIYNFSYTDLGYQGYLDRFIFRGNFRLINFNFDTDLTFPRIFGMLIHPKDGSLNDLNKDLLFYKDDLHACRFCKLKEQKPEKDNTELSPQIFNPKEVSDEGIGYIKLISNDNSNPTSLLHLLLLLYYGSVDIKPLTNTKQYNITYEIGTLCNSTSRYLHKFYILPSTNQNLPFNPQIIESITIKYTRPENQLWKTYIDKISDSFESFAIFNVKYNKDTLTIEKIKN